MTTLSDYRFTYARYVQSCVFRCGTWFAIGLPIFSHSPGEWICTACHYELTGTR